MSTKSPFAMSDDARAAGAGIQRLSAGLLHRAFSGELTAKWREKNRALVAKEIAEQKRLLASSV